MSQDAPLSQEVVCGRSQRLKYSSLPTLRRRAFNCGRAKTIAGL